MHIALQASDAQTVDWLLHHGARIDARADGLFFQPMRIAVLPDNNSTWWWQDKVEENKRAGCYYGGFPLSFAASTGDVQVAQDIITFATCQIEASLHSSSPFAAWLDAQVLHLTHNSEEFNEQFPEGEEANGGGHGTQLSKRRLAGLINAQDPHGNTALHMACEHKRPDMVNFLIRSSAMPSLSLMNADERTPLTLSLREPAIFKLLLKEAFCETVWEYGDNAMTLLSLYQVYTKPSTLNPKPCRGLY